MFLVRLLGRALNSFELSDALLRRLGTALAHDSALYSAYHSAGLHRTTHRHTWLLADGTAVTLWELVHNTTPPQPDPSAPAGQPRETEHERRERPEEHEIYATQDQLENAMARLPLPMDDPTGFDLPLAPPLSPVPSRHGYVPDASADHARRLLRRAENADRPDGDTLRLLGTAYAYHITQAFGRPATRAGARLGFSLYEHTFLFADGREISLWEVEHTATPDGRHMCEVYSTESAARRAMELRAAQATRTT